MPKGVKVPYGTALLNQTYAEYRKSAIKRGYEFNLPINTFIDLLLKSCYYCGQPPSRLVKHGGLKAHFAINGIDRIDNKIGYTLENSISCCSFCNNAKKDYTLDDFLSWIQRAANYQMEAQHGSPSVTES